MSYNGWKNYETWAAKLWIDNDEGTYSEPERIALECIEDVRGDDGDIKENALHSFTEQLEGWAEETFLADIPNAGLANDLLRSAWENIDWREIAWSYLSDIDIEEEA